MVHFLYSAFSDESGEATLQGQIDACKANGITHMELRGFGSGPNINNITTEKAKELRAILDKNGMHLSAIGSAYGKIKIKDDFAPHFEAFKNTIEVAKILGAPYIRVFSFYFDSDDDYEAYRDEVLRRVQAMADYGYEHGVLCCHENEKGIYGDNAERCLDVLQNVRHLRGVFDPANFVQCGQETLEAWRLLAGRIDYLHIKDALADGTVVPAGCGTGHLADILRAYLARGGRAMTVEPHLRVFDGLAALERSGDTSVIGERYSYPSADAAFDAACGALQGLLERGE